jgi:putative ABC transport system permease protein
MTLVGIAWRNIRQRAVTSGLTALSLALGVALVVATLVTGSIVRRAFSSGTGLGYNMIVGAKGSPLQLVLNSVYYISRPIENLPWRVYEEFLPAAVRSDGNEGDFAASTAVAVPICMGDYWRGYRVIGTNASMFERLKRGGGEPYRFAEGRNMVDANFFEGVVGAEVARRYGLSVGDTFAPTHGADDGPVHDPFTLVGILERTDTPVDRGVFVNMEGFYLQEGHAKPLDAAGDADAAQGDGGGPPADARPVDASQARGAPPLSSAGRAALPYDQREVTAILLETASGPGMLPELTAMLIRPKINEGPDAQAAEPVREIRQLLDLFVRPLELLLLLVTTLVVIVSAVGILVSMVGSTLERKRDVAVMRALGARRSHVLATVLIEAVLLAVAGGLCGWVLGHLLVGAIGPFIATNAGVSASVLSADPGTELLLVPGLVLLAIAAGVLPAVAAYRTDVARWL